MKRGGVLFGCVVALLSATHPESAGKCQDIPIRVTLYANAVIDSVTGATTPSAITSDGRGEYTSANILVCSGTYDAVTTVDGGRTLTFNFPSPVAGSVIEGTPAWVPGSSSVTGWLNIRNILFSKGSNQPFATMAGSTFNRSGGRTQYRLGFKGTSPVLPNAPNLHDGINMVADNTPFPSSPVIVYPTYPVPCGTGAMPTWLVRATSPNSPRTELEVATLHQEPSGPRASQVHLGQYSLPFELRIDAMKCFAY